MQFNEGDGAVQFNEGDGAVQFKEGDSAVQFLTKVMVQIIGEDDGS